ncbi:hypothetical protein L1887_00585 [Cichorium endivia]|nr:hypothetical protein L1887_00585 [Cichorium endivia]
MATLESLPISFSRLSCSSNPPLMLPTKLKISIPTCTRHKPHYSPLTISRKFQAFSTPSTTAAIQEDIPVEQNEIPDETQKEIIQKRLFVLNLPWSYAVDDLKNLFTECGTVEDAEIIKRKKDGKSRGYAFVTMGSTEEALSIIQKFDSHELMGRIIRVEFAKDNKKSSSSSSPPLTSPGEKRYKLYVSNLAWRVRANHLREFFGELNPVSTRVVFESPEGRSAGYGFVTFGSKEEAESAISGFNGKELLGRAITLAFSERDGDKSETEEEEASIEEPVES